MKYFTCRTFRLLFIILLGYCGFVQAGATEIKPGVLYKGGTSLLSSEYGLEFTVPQGWQAILPRGAEVMIMEPGNAVARIIISAVTNSNEAGLMQLMNQHRPLDAASQLVPGEQAVKKGKFYHQRYTIHGNNPQNLAAEAYAALGDNNTAFFAIILEPKDKAQFNVITKNLVGSVRFKAAKPQVVQQASDKNINWEQELKGRTLNYMRTENGMSINRKMNLCSNHNFSYSESENYVSSDVYTDFSTASQSGNKGRWQIKGNKLLLQWSDGTKSSFALSRRYVEEWDEWGTFVDGERWFVVANRAC